jgi:hypothetical protein
MATKQASAGNLETVRLSSDLSGTTTLVQFLDDAASSISPKIDAAAEFWR